MPAKLTGNGARLPPLLRLSAHTILIFIKRNNSVKALDGPFQNFPQKVHTYKPLELCLAGCLHNMIKDSGSKQSENNTDQKEAGRNCRVFVLSLGSEPGFLFLAL